MIEDNFINGLELHFRLGMHTFMIEDLIQRGCPCYSIVTAQKVTSITNEVCKNEHIELGPPPGEHSPKEDHDGYEYNKLTFRLARSRFPVKDLIQHYRDAHGNKAAAELIEKLHNIRGEQHKQDPNPLATKRRDSYLKVIAATVWPRGKKGQIDFKGQSSTVKRRIEELGLELNEDTVRSILKETIEFMRQN